MTIMIEVGKKYLTKTGEVVGPMTTELHYFIEEKENLISPFFGIRQSWQADGRVTGPGPAMDSIQDIVSEYVEPGPLVIVEGKKYLMKNGGVVGPMVCFKGEDGVFTADNAPNTLCVNGKPLSWKQKWEGNGKVYVGVACEEPHTIVAELTVTSEVERLQACINGLKGKLERVQNIHAHTIKTVRRARAQLKKVNAALSEEQRKNGALRNRLAECVKAVGDASEYVAKVGKPVPAEKKKKEKKWADLEAVNIINQEHLAREAEGDVKALFSAFTWGTSPQGDDHWRRINSGGKQMTETDKAFLRALLKR